MATPQQVGAAAGAHAGCFCGGTGPAAEPKGQTGHVWRAVCFGRRGPVSPNEDVVLWPPSRLRTWERREVPGLERLASVSRNAHVRLRGDTRASNGSCHWASYQAAQHPHRNGPGCRSVCGVLEDTVPGESRGRSVKRSRLQHVCLAGAETRPESHSNDNGAGGGQEGTLLSPAPRPKQHVWGPGVKRPSLQAPRWVTGRVA
ncbi:uncharacterized protein LOC114006399 [Tupaia chinensis]|uniref:uncharacterized protein LOC114006399 n=1 Tax=Tupaia chinensis TaxID=246437 RepID=UPI000FFC2765|nr:uncharacterized protein LOC114006399 [Tupaia chinensis]